MKRVIVAVAAIAALILGISLVIRALESPETKIRKRLLRMAEDFDGGRSGPCSRGLAEDFVDATTGARVSEVRALLAQMSLSERDPRTKEFLHRVTLPEEEMTVLLDPAEPTKAQVDFIAIFEERRGEEWRLEWRVSISAEMFDGEDGWQVRRTTHETLEGQRFR